MLYLQSIKPVPPAVLPPKPFAGPQESAEPVRLLPQKWFTLGSMGPQDGYNLLVTFTNLGAGIERIELTERDHHGRFKYPRTDVRHGYLGYVAATLGTDSGAIVNVVGPGSPAQLAKGSVPGGLQPDDLIVSFNQALVESPDDLEAELLKTKPGDTVTMQVHRPAGNGNPPTKLVFSADLTNHPLDLIRLSSRGGPDEVVGNLDQLSALITLARLGGRDIPTGKTEIPGIPSQHRSHWESNHPPRGLVGDSLEFRLALDQGQGGVPVEVVRRFKLRPASDVRTLGFGIDLEHELINKSDQTQQMSYRLQGTNGMSLEGWWYSTKISPNWSGAGARDIVYKTARDGHRLFSNNDLRKHAISDAGKKDPEKTCISTTEPEQQRSLHYVAVDTQYFDTGLIPSEAEAPPLVFDRVAAFPVTDFKKHKAVQYQAANPSFLVESVPEQIPAGEKLVGQKMTLFAGPKQPSLLANVGMRETIEYGWFPWVAIPLSGLLHTFYWLVGNYGLAIIMLTVLVRLCLFPLGRKAAVNAQRMQELAPELKKIAEKYKDDLPKRMEAQRDLQRKAGFNPLSGCLPVFIQIPIFIGLYRCLSVDIELRSAPLVQGWEWCSNLAAPDMFGHWESWLPEFFAGRGSGWLGPYFNVLPVVVVALFLIQQKMFMPPATDEQTRMTQQVMNWMTVVMGVFFFKMPAGLCVYFITSSLWSIAERKLVKKTLPPQNPNNEAATPASPPVPFWPGEKKLSVSEQIALKRKRRKKTRPA
jgi:YidC/Oxa1 family membrane protein insertase